MYFDQGIAYKNIKLLLIVKQKTLNLLTCHNLVPPTFPHLLKFQTGRHHFLNLSCILLLTHLCSSYIYWDDISSFYLGFFLAGGGKYALSLSWILLKQFVSYRYFHFYRDLSENIELLQVEINYLYVRLLCSFQSQQFLIHLYARRV